MHTPSQLSRTRMLFPVLMVVLLVAASCGSDADVPQAAPEADTQSDEAPAPADEQATATTAPVDVVVETGEPTDYPAPPAVIDGPLAQADADVIETMLNSIQSGFSSTLVTELESNGDARLLWVLSDWLRFVQGTDLGNAMLSSAEAIAGTEFDSLRPWNDLTNHLIAWDLPAPPGYKGYKGRLFAAVDERWEFVFADPDSDIDYRILSWGGVLIDDRELGDTEACSRGCIPSLDDPAVTPAADGDWYPDDRVVFGVEIEGEAVAFPKNIMEIHEMVNMTIGGRRIAMPYCTLCGSAQVFLTDEVAGVARPPVLRTSGLLSRSNKVMYDLDSQSVFDTFTGVALSGPLRAARVVLPQASVVTTTWADWRANYPDTAIVAEDGGIGRTYRLDPLGARDDNGPIFPVGDVDPRLGVQTQVLGIELPDATYVAFPVDAARATLQNGDEVTLGSTTVELDGAGLRATVGGEPIASHQAFWFAWSQFHPDTELWLPGE